MLRHEWLRAWIENFAPSLPLRTFVAAPAARSPPPCPDRAAGAKRGYLLRVHDHLADAGQRPFAAGGVLLGRGGDDGLRLIWETLRPRRMDRLRLHDLPDGAPSGSCEAGQRAAILRVLGLAAVALLALPESYEAVEKALDGKFRQNLRRRKRRLASRAK